MPFTLRFRVPVRLLPGAACAVALLMLLGSRPALAGPSGYWERISPPPQAGGATAYDSARRLLYVFGGDGTNILHASTVDGPPEEWVNVKATGTPPSARAGLAMAYDGANDRLIVFGGEDNAHHLHDDLWQLTLAGTPTWSPIATTGSAPGPRSYVGACFDEARQVLLVFGGKDSLGAVATSRIFQIDLGLPTPTWTPISPAGATPSARYGLTLCDDAVHDRAILFGGNDGGSDLADAYTMDYASHTWTLVPASGDVPAGRSHHFGAYDAAHDLFFLWGGSGSDDQVRSLALATGQWTIEANSSWQAAPVGHTHPVGTWVPGESRFLVVDGNNNTNVFDFVYSPPSGSYWQNWRDPGLLGETCSSASFVYDRADGVAFLSGGDNEFVQPMQSTWGYWLGGPNGWINMNLWSTADNNTPPLTQHVAVWDEARRRMLLFGGMTTGYIRSNGVYAMSVDSYLPFNIWTPVTPAGTPPTARFGTSAIYDPVGDRMLVFGGSDATGYTRGDLWQLHLSPTPTWSPIVAPGAPPGRYGHTAIYDERKHRMIVFGGSDSLTGFYDNDVWALNLPALTWTHLLPTGTPAPGRAQHTAVYDSRRERMLVFGGHVETGASMSDMWALDLAPATPVWSKLTPGLTAAGLPITRFAHAAVYDSIGDRMLVYGGLLPPFSIFGNDYPLKDLWSLQFDFSAGTTAVDPPHAGLEFAMGVPSPNPARGATRLSYTLGHASHVRAEIYDLAGRRIVGLEDGQREAGRHELQWTGRNAAGSPVNSGLYFYRLEADGHTGTQKVLLVR